MDCELRRRFLQFLSFDLAAVEMRDLRIPRPIGKSKRYDWPIKGPELWPLSRAWWTTTTDTIGRSGQREATAQH